jgi:hypothetical protein
LREQFGQDLERDSGHIWAIIFHEELFWFISQAPACRETQNLPLLTAVIGTAITVLVGLVSERPPPSNGATSAI